METGVKVLLWVHPTPCYPVRVRLSVGQWSTHWNLFNKLQRVGVKGVDIGLLVF